MCDDCAAAHLERARSGGDPTGPESLCRSDLGRFIVAIAQHHDRAAFTALFEMVAPRLHTYFRVRGAPEEVAQESVQDTLGFVWRSAGTFDPTVEDALAWLFAAARVTWMHRAESYISLRDARFRARVQPLPPPSPKKRIVVAERTAAVAQAIDSLPPQEATIVRDVFYRGMSHGEIAKARGIPLGTVKTALRRALERLRTTFGQRLRADHEGL